ncbi:MAG: RNase H-like domain-containing protein [Sedimenticola sp.]
MSCETTDTLQEVPDYLVDLLKRSSAHLDPSESKKLEQLLIKYRHVFAKSDDDLGVTNIVRHHINTQGATPIKQPFRRLPLGKREVEREEIKKMLARGVIEPSISPWSSPIVLITKKDGSTRFCVDFRAVNQVVKKDSFPLARVDECLESLSGSTYFSCMDLNQGYLQMGLEPNDMEKTAFSTSLGLYHFTRLPYGLVTAPSEFSRLMGEVLRGLQWTECCVYMDDIIVPSLTLDESLVRLEHVFQRLLAARLKLKPRKCAFLQKTVKVLGHVVSSEGVATDDDKIATVRDWPVPTSAKNLKSFIGLASYYKRYVQDFSKIAKPLYQLGEKGVKFKWPPAAQQAFNTLKEALISAPILGFPREGVPFILDTDCSDFAMGAVLSQIQDNDERVIAYMSKTLNKHEVLYCTTRKELLSLVTSVKHFHHYLYGQEVHVRTDNAAVSWMKNLKGPEGQTARWLQYLESYNLNLSHRPGRLHTNADALSRRPCNVCQRNEQRSQDAKHSASEPESRGVVESVSPSDVATSEFVASLMLATPDDIMSESLPTCVSLLPLISDHAESEPSSTIESDVSTSDTPHSTSTPNYGTPVDDAVSHVRVTTRAQQQRLSSDELKQNQWLLDGWLSSDISNEQTTDEHIGPIISAFECKKQPTWNQIAGSSSKTKTLWRQWERLELHGGLLYRKWTIDNTNSHLQLVVPECKQADVLHYFHDIPTAGHLGTDKTLERIRQNFYWPAMSATVKNYCQQCNRCAARKPAKPTKAPLGSCQVGEPMEKVAVDLLGPLPVTNRGNRYVLTIVDLFTKWTEAVAIPDAEASTVATALIDNFITRMGAPLILLSDLGKCFEAKLFQSVCEHLKINKIATSVMRPQANGVVERFNRTLTSMLTMYCETEQHKWDTYLQQVMMAYRASRHTTTGFTPNRLVFGREVTLPLTAMIGTPVAEPSAENVDAYVDNLSHGLEGSHDVARKALKSHAVYRKRHYDLKAKHRSLTVGQPIWIYDPSRKVGVCSKLTCKWKGPCLITKKIDDMVYLVKRTANKPAKAIHIDRMRPYAASTLPRWFKNVKLIQ